MSFLFFSKTADLNSAFTKSHMDFSVLSLSSSSRKTWLRNQNLVSIYPRCGVISENVTGGHFEISLYRCDIWCIYSSRLIVVSVRHSGLL